MIRSIQHKGYTITLFPLEEQYKVFTSKNSIISTFIDTEKEAIKYIDNYLKRIESSKIETIFEKVQRLNIKYDNHCSDLYIPQNKITDNLIDEYDFKQNVTTFHNEGDNSIWYDIPFAYDEFWKGA